MGKTLLIVDDEPHIRFLLKQSLEDLEQHGVELMLAGDGREALEVATAVRPDLVFLDVMMPYLDGYEVCRRIKAMDRHICVILLTAKGQIVDKERGTAAGADQYITKPFDPDYILERAAEALGLSL